MIKQVTVEKVNCLPMLQVETPQYSRKQNQILQGAMQVFLRSGYAATSMDRVAAEAGVSKQTIYSHFRDKEGLFKALIERATIARIRRSVDLDAIDGHPAVLLRQLARIYFTEVVDDPDYLPLMRIVIGESERFPELAKVYTQTVIQRGRQLLCEYFDRHPELGISDAEALAQIFFGSMVSFVIVQEMLYAKEFSTLSRDRLVETLIDLVLTKVQ